MPSSSIQTTQGAYAVFSSLFSGLPEVFDMVAPQLIAYAKQKAPEEACGLIVHQGDGQTSQGWHFIPFENKSARPLHEFCISEESFAHLSQRYRRVVIFHSHPSGPACPSHADMCGVQQTSVPWLGVALDSPIPKFFCLNWYWPAAISGRFYLHGVWDCYSLIKDYYSQYLRCRLPEFPRGWNWWHEKQDLYHDHYASAGFVQINEGSGQSCPLQYGDVFLASIRSEVPNHAGLYLGNGLIFHHLAGRHEHDNTRLPRREPAERWQKFITGWLRHRQFVSSAPPLPSLPTILTAFSQ